MIIEITKSNIEKITDNNIIENINSNPFAKYLIYFENNNIIGYLYFSDIYDRIEIINFEVIKERRKEGIGTKLLEKLISYNKPITLEVSIENINAINLYEKLGFKQVAIRKGYYKGIDGILMQRK